MGESIAEGTIVRWIKKVGDQVDRDEPLFEISTDKVDAEIPSPAAGVLMDIAVKEGETVAINSVVATIGAVGEKIQARERPPRTRRSRSRPENRRHACHRRRRRRPPSHAHAHHRRPRTRTRWHTWHLAPGHPTAPEEADHQKSSPLVRRIAKEHNVDIGQIQGSGIGGRVTKQDILTFIDRVAARPSTRRPLALRVTGSLRMERWLVRRPSQFPRASVIKSFQCP